MRIHATADSVRIETDEGGFHLVVETDEGDVIDVKIHDVVEDFYWNARKTIGSWLSERDAARFSRLATYEDLEAYDRGDPKRISLERELERRGSIG